MSSHTDYCEHFYDKLDSDIIIYWQFIDDECRRVFDFWKNNGETSNQNFSWNICCQNLLETVPIGVKLLLLAWVTEQGFEKTFAACMRWKNIRNFLYQAKTILMWQQILNDVQLGVTHHNILTFTVREYRFSHCWCQMSWKPHQNLLWKRCENVENL